MQDALRVPMKSESFHEPSRFSRERTHRNGKIIGGKIMTEFGEAICRSEGAWIENFGAGGYRHGAPTDLFEMVHGPEKEEKK